MKKLYELARFCSQQRNVVEALIQGSENLAIWKLYKLLLSEESMNNSEAMLETLGRIDTKQFSALKARMLDILVKTISIQNVSSDNENIRFNKVLASLRKNIAARIILYKGSRSLAIDVLESALTNSLLDQVTYDTLDQLRLLKLHYGTSSYNKYKLNRCIELEKYYSDLLENETKAINYFIDLKKIELQSLAQISVKDRELAVRYAKELTEINARSKNFNYYRFQVLVKKCEFERNFSELLDLCDKAELEFSSNEFFSASSLIVVKQVRLWTLIQLGNYSESIPLGLSEISNADFGVTNWYSFLHYTLKAFLYSAKYSEAVDLISFCVKHPNFKKLNLQMKELANLHLGYIHLLADSELDFKASFNSKKLPEFKLGKFLNTTPVFSKDKRGINVSILLMHIAFLLQRKDYNAIIDRVDSLNQYAYRYLRKDDSFRSNCMIKMVIQMTKADFNPIRTARYTADLRKQLGHVTLAGSGENIEVEIIPFEVLWEIMTKAL
ncbi:MAG: hypothetical protein IPL92_05035 [Saprospiraceae bacterium]|nr:hypothetical protein [Candidatus Opimibacter iunctus]